MGPRIARGPGPKPLRTALVVVACLYYLALLKHPAATSILRPIAFFMQCTKLFPGRDPTALEYRLEAWSCERKDWIPLDPRPYFPIEPDDKESRFQRLGYFYHDERIVMNALDDYIMARHADVDDGAPGKIGGIRVVRVNTPIPDLGQPVERYVYRPMEPAPAEHRKDLFWTKQSVRKQRCGGD